jgi:hypothetical protein
MARPRDQRRLVHLNGQLLAGDAWRAVTICNVSPRGLMGKCAKPPETGEPVEVRHHAFTLTGQVTWSQGDRFGVICDTPIDVAALLDGVPDVRVGRRSLPRLTVRIPGELVLRDNVFTVLLVDISQTGARVYMPLPPCAGANAVLAWGEHERRCTVLWAKGDAFGVEFEEVVSADTVRSLRPCRERRRGQEAALPIWSKPQIPVHLQPGVTLARRAVRDHQPPRRSDPLTRRVRG